jgi:septal ring factor EnvC (AmiA/AmiB activator)
LNQETKEVQKFEFKISSLNENISSTQNETKKNEKLISDMEIKLNKEIGDKSLDEEIQFAESSCTSFRELDYLF